MNKIRQEIIKLIEPYMEKDLSEWCLVKNISSCITKDELFKGYNRASLTWKKWHIYFKYIWDWDLIKDFEKTNWDSKDLKILWHYDISAVLKYIDKNFSWTNEFDYEYIYLYENQMMSWMKREELKLPNKPLYLYSEEQEADLLKLLKKLQ